MRVLAFVIALFIVVPNTVFSQCFEINRITKQAKILYEKGDLEGTIELLTKILKEEKVKQCPTELEKANILLTQSYLFLNQDDLAENTYKTILNNNPSFLPNLINHPVDLVYLSEKFATLPTSKLSINILRNNPIISVNQVYLPTNFSTGTKSYILHPNYSFGFQYSRFLNNTLQLTIGTEYEERKFEIDYYEADTSSITLFTDYTAKEKQVWLKFPVFIQKSFGNKEHLKYNAIAGLEAHFLTNATFEEVRGAANANERLFDKNIINLRTKLHLGITAGFGLEYQFPSLPNNAVSLQLKYTYIPTRVNNSAMRFSRNDLYNRFGYLDDDFRFDVLQLSLGYAFIQYKVKELKMK